MRELKADIVDEHYYMAPKWFRDNAGRYDDYPRTGPKVFAGEYAAQSVGSGELPTTATTGSARCLKPPS